MVVTLLSNQLDPQSDHHLLPVLRENEMCIGDTFHVNILNKVIKKKSRLSFLKRDFLNMAPLTGLEPVTYGLTVRRSTD